MNSNFTGPINIGSDEMVSINELADRIMVIAEKNLRKVHIPGPLGVRGRKSDNRLIKHKLGWAPSQSLNIGLQKTYRWIEKQIGGQKIRNYEVKQGGISVSQYCSSNI
jgi:nucleoside-diphosphate-sugar epimerase